MNPEKVNSIITILLSLVPFFVVGAWLVYKTTKSKHSLFKNPEENKKIIRVGGNTYIVKKVSRLLAVEKKTGREAIVTTCGFENEQERIKGELDILPEGVRVHYRLENGIFSPEESDWLAGEDFKVLGVAQVEEYKKHNT